MKWGYFKSGRLRGLLALQPFGLLLYILAHLKDLNTSNLEILRPNETFPNENYPNETYANETYPNETLPNETYPNET